MKDSAFLFVATLKNSETIEEDWEGKIKAISKKFDSGLSSMEKNILQKLRKEVRSECDRIENSMQKIKEEEASRIEGIEESLQKIREEEANRIGGIEESLKLIIELMKNPAHTN